MKCCDAGKGNKSDFPGTARCPVNGQEYKKVSLKTLLQHVRYPANQHINMQGYYFCSSPDCDVVYFGGDGLLFSKDDIREVVGQKSKQAERTLCYCFGITQQDVEQEIYEYGYSPSYRFVVEQTKQSNCSCESQNPSGRCCLKEFPKAAKKQFTQQ